MKKWLIVIAALLPLSSMANMLNNTSQPNQPGYNPSQQRMQTQMQEQQKLRQDQQQQNQEMQRKLQERRDSARARVIQSQPGQQNSGN